MSRQSVDSADRPYGVMLVGHGTRDDVGTEQFFRLGKQLAERLRPTPMEPALLEFQRPTIPEAWDALVARGAQHVVVAPLLLFAAGHAKQDIPQIIAQCQARNPQVSAGQTQPLSRHASVVELAIRRISETLRGLGTAPDRAAVVMVGRGSHDPCAQADMKLLAEVAGRRVAAASTITAFYAMAEPRLEEVLDAVASSRRLDAIAVYPHLLLAGRLYDAIRTQTEDAAKRYPSVQMRVSRYLGPDPLVVDAIAARIAQSRT